MQVIMMKNRYFYKIINIKNEKKNHIRNDINSNIHKN